LILGSGDVTMAAQPNTGGGSSLGGSGSSGSDVDLASITPNNIFDECVVEFDFVPIGDSIKFRYVFASEEYEEYVCGNVNDAFGFFLTGNNPLGGMYNSQNLALIPDPNNPTVFTSTPVSINTVNPGVAGTNGTAATCDAIDPNWASYNVFYAGANTSTNYEYDGNTVVLECRAAVNCNETYHIKLAIGDGGDSSFDSGVFLEGGSFTSVGVEVTAGIANGDSLLYENCNSAFFAFTRPDTTTDFTVYFDMGGTAVNGIDYLPVPDSLTMSAGVLSDTIVIFPINDGIDEPAETVDMNILFETCSGNFDTVTATLVLNDYTPMQLSLVDSLNICPPEAADLHPTFTGGLDPIVFSWNTGSSVDSITVNPLMTTDYTLTVTDGCDNEVDATSTVYVQCPVSPPNVFTPNGDGENDVFQLESLDHYEGNAIVIYNRWGRIVYENDNYQNDWDGTHYKSGTNVAEGVYYYVVTVNSEKYEYNDMEDPELRKTINGFVQIMR